MRVGNNLFRQESKNAILESETQLLGSNSALAVQPAARPEMEVNAHAERICSLKQIFSQNIRSNCGT